MNDLLRALQALADPTRFEVFCLIRQGAGTDSEPGWVALSEVRRSVACVPSTLSHHLNVLREAGLIETERRGRTGAAHVRSESLAALSSFFAAHVGNAGSSG